MRVSARLLIGLVGLLALGRPVSAPAAAYYVVQSGPEAWTVMDPQSIETIPGDGVIRKAWSVRVQRNILTGNPPQPGYVRTLSEYDCDKTRTRWLEFSAFSRSGEALISRRNPDPEWGPTTDASEIYAAFNLVCLGKGNRAVVSAESVAKVVISLMAAWDPPPVVPTPTTKRKVPATTAKPTAKPVSPKAVTAKATTTKPPVPKVVPAPKAKTP